MTEPFVETETDRTKSRWVAKALKEFGRSKTTTRALFYYAMHKGSEGLSDYPICGGFVGEIRITRPYSESDGERLPKWVGRAKKLGFIPEESLIDETSGEEVFLPQGRQEKPYRIEVWSNKSSIGPLLQRTCCRYGAAVVTTGAAPSKEVIEDLWKRADLPTVILCLCDLSVGSFTFSQDLSQEIARLKSSGRCDIRVKHIALTPRQVIDLKIPMVRGEKCPKEAKDRYKECLEPYGLDHKKMAEIDALEVFYPGGIAKFVDDELSKCSVDLGDERRLADLSRGVLPKDLKIGAVG